MTASKQASKETPREKLSLLVSLAVQDCRVGPPLTSLCDQFDTQQTDVSGDPRPEFLSLSSRSNRSRYRKRCQVLPLGIASVVVVCTQHIYIYYYCEYMLSA
jgi:hypothetical protein